MTIAKVYGLAMKSMLNKEVDWDSDTIKVVLCTSSYTPNQDTHQYASSLTNELSGGSYSRQTITSPTVAYDGSTNILKLSCANVTFSAITASAVRYAIFVDTQTGSDSTSPLICYMDFEADQTLTAQDLTLVIPSTGVVTLTAA